jgi:hypothetical protein
MLTFLAKRVQLDEKETWVKKVLLTAFLFCVFTIGDGTLPERAFSSENFMFPEMGGWKQSGEVQTFSPKDLYEYIDGASDLYLSYDFEELGVAEYQNEKKAAVTVEVYRHQTPEDAFGIYSQERFPTATFLAVGAQGYGEKDFLNFVTGPYYVKISSYKLESEGQETLLSFARKVAENLREKGQLPSILRFFPAEGKISNSEKFIARKFLGYPFLYSAFTADYTLSGKKFQVFIIDRGDRNECRAMIERYLQELGQPGKNAVEGRFTLSDPHHGEVDLLWKEGRIWGILSLDDPALRSKYLQLVEQGLR